MRFVITLQARLVMPEGFSRFQTGIVANEVTERLDYLQKVVGAKVVGTYDIKEEENE